VGLPAAFALEIEDVYRHTSGAHRALAFPDFLGLLIGLGLEEYRRTHGAKSAAPEIGDVPPKEESINVFNIPRKGIQDLFREFDAAMEPPEAVRPGPRLVSRENLSCLKLTTHSGKRCYFKHSPRN
jgi:hypothetical protein